MKKSHLIALTLLTFSVTVPAQAEEKRYISDELSTWVRSGPGDQYRLVGKLNALTKEMIVYKAPKEQHVITVFTDITCGYCHKLHEQMSDYNALGITVRYLAFPRQGLQSQAEQDMKAIWCAKDRNKALDDAMNGKGVQPASCSVDIAKHYTLGVQMGVNGTPAMVLSNGMVLPGYQGPKELKAFLDEHQKQTSGN